jgi:4-hydroxy-4-methyl-2-oxoglutarate aldolase
VNPGDVVIADADGVVVVPRSQAIDVSRLGEQRRAKEEKTRERLSKGELGVDFYGLRAKLAELGVEYVDHLADGSGEPAVARRTGQGD